MQEGVVCVVRECAVQSVGVVSEGVRAFLAFEQNNTTQHKNPTIFG